MRNILLRFLMFTTLFLLWKVMRAQDSLISSDTIAFSVEMDEFLVTAQYKPTDSKSAIHSIQVITREQMDRRAATQLDQALMISPSIRFEQDQVLGPKLVMRGLDANHVAILIDGVPVIGRLDGAIDLSQISMQNIERIEIVEGPLSTLYGSNATGGVINLISKKQQIRKISLSSSSQAESIGSLNNQLNLGFNNKRSGFTVYGRFFGYNPYPVDSLRLIENRSSPSGITSVSKYPWNPKVQWNLGGDINFQMSPAQKFKVKYDYLNESVTDYGQVRRPTYKPYANDLHIQTRRSDIAATYDGIIKNKYFVEGILAFNNYKRTNEDQRTDLESMLTDSSLTVRDESLFQSLFTKWNLAVEWGHKSSLVMGVSHQTETGRGDRILDRTQKDTSRTSSVENALYSEFKYQAFTKLSLAVSGRLNHHSRYKFNLTPAIHFKYKPFEKWQIRSGFAAGYRNPALKELNLEFIDINHYILGNPQLKPETSTDFHLNSQFDLNKKVNFIFNMYRTRISNRISLTEYAQLRYKYENVGEYEVRGFQLIASSKFSFFSFNNSFSLGFWETNLEHTSAPAFGTVPDMNHSFDVDIPRINIHAHINYRMVGSQPYYSLQQDELTVSKLESQHFLDASLSRHIFKKAMQISVGAKNLLNLKSANLSGAVSGSGTHSGGGNERVISQGRNYFVRINFNLTS